MSLGQDARAATYGLREGLPYAGQTLRVLVADLPQFRGIAARDAEFTELSGIEVDWQFVPPTHLQERFVAEAGAAGGYDVVSYRDSWGPAQAGWLVPLDDWMARDGIVLDGYPAPVAALGRFAGHTYGLPVRAEVQLLFFRRDLVPNPPRTWGDLIALGLGLPHMHAGVAPLALHYYDDGNRDNLDVWLYFLRAAGVELFDAQGKAAWDTPAAASVTEEYIGMRTRFNIVGRDALAQVGHDAVRTFREGKAALLPAWSGTYAQLTDPRHTQLSRAQVGFIFMPAYQGNLGTRVTGMPFSVSGHSSRQDAAWEFLKWAANPALDRANAIDAEIDGQAIRSNVVTRLSSFGDSTVNDHHDHIQRAVLTALDGAGHMPHHPAWPAIGDLLSEALAKAAGGGDVRELLAASARQANTLLDQAAAATDS